MGATRALVCTYAAQRCDEHFTVADTGILRAVLTGFVGQGKFVRSTFAYLGWLCGRPESDAAARAAASLELLHAFALIQDDVMDDSATRRGSATVHVQLAHWAERQRRPVGAQFGRSAAVLLSDLCLVWAERMLRESGLPAESLAKALPVYDLLRSELAVGQFSDLLNENSAAPSLNAVLDIARRKSGNYTVLRPLELGAVAAGCSPQVLAALRQYGTAIGEAFQLRDDLLGVFGDPLVTGKPLGDDLYQAKATTIVVAAGELAGDTERRELRRLTAGRPLPGVIDERWIQAWQRLIVDTGADELVEKMIAERVEAAVTTLADEPGVPSAPRAALTVLADRCTQRTR
ncbi:polyprenyl synthetase family protein [Kribbella flavida]|uniref:polyprenyl synthetase family protein n=1 Tax=Kribbella flavida TaxID=182640 RepID=UPI00019BDB2F|nr:polyprenyl synthetase family protein [Kribbella flavida]